jgi:hypothetical protein
MEKPVSKPEFQNFKVPEVTDDVLKGTIASYEYEVAHPEVDPCFYCTITLRNGFKVQGAFRPDAGEKVQTDLGNRRARADAQAQVIRILQYRLYDIAYWQNQVMRAKAGVEYDHPEQGPQPAHEVKNNPEPAMRRVESSNIEALGWSSTFGLLVEFKNGARWKYPAVPAGVYHEIMNAPSVGSAYNASVKGRYEGEQLPKAG